MSALNDCVGFLQQLIQTPSLPGEEGDLANLVYEEMTRLGYDEVSRDEAGNIIGCIRGRGEAPAVMFNTHLDHVDVGDHARWPYPPFGGEIHDECVWGRGAVDIKGPLATQVHGVGRLKSEGFVPPGDVFVTGVVFEEIGGLGAQHLLEHLQPPLIVIGEPSKNELRRGHRGRLEFQVHVRGKSVHASVPQRGVNPLAVIAKLIDRLDEIHHKVDGDLGPSTVAPTLIRTDQTSSNVVPSEVWLTLDWRHVPDESENEILADLNRLLQECLIPGSDGNVSLPPMPRRCYTGREYNEPANNHPFITRRNNPALEAAEAVLQEHLGAAPPVDLWRFATDGGHFARAGLLCIGIGPGDENLAHTVDEHIPIAQLSEAMDIYEALAKDWALRARA